VALAHAISDAVEAAYRRGDLFEKRRKLMGAWAAYCAKVETDAGKVVAKGSSSVVKTPPLKRKPWLFIAASM